MESLPLVVLGLLLGMLHATDADHVVAVATIVGREGSLRSAARVGLLWGLGHTLTVSAVGLAIILANVVVPPRLEMAMEFCVALMLMGLGLTTLRRAGRRLHRHGDTVHAHRHDHPGAAHAHRDTPLGWLDRHLGVLRGYAALRPVVIGIVHGLAGSAAVALLVLTQIRSPGWAAVYLLLFGAGTTLGMVLMSSAIALPFVGSRRRPWLNLGLQAAAGALSLGLGCYMAWKLGVVDGLFAAPGRA